MASQPAETPEKQNEGVALPGGRRKLANGIILGPDGKPYVLHFPCYPPSAWAS